MISIGKITTNLKPLEDGVWVSKDRSETSYPEEGIQICFQVEDSSFWFNHRNDCIVDAMRQFPPGGTVLDLGGGNDFVSVAITVRKTRPLGTRISFSVFRKPTSSSMCSRTSNNPAAGTVPGLNPAS